MRIVTGILMIIGAVLLAVIAIGAIQWEAVICFRHNKREPVLKETAFEKETT